MLDTQYKGTPPRGASLTSGTVSATTAITAGHIVINTITFPALAIPSPATAAQRCQDIVDLINAHKTLTGVMAVRVTATTYSLRSGVAITGTLGATATVATFGFVTSLTGPLTPVLLASRRVAGTEPLGVDGNVVAFGSQMIDVGHCKHLGMISLTGAVDVEVDVAQASTRVNS